MAAPETLMIPSPKGSEATGGGGGGGSKKGNSPKPLMAASPRPAGSCLCSPTQHQGSFRCRFHRSLCTEWSMRRSKSMPSSAAAASSSSSSSKATAACQAP